MADIPAEAVQAAAIAIERALMSGEDFAMAADSDERLARAAVEAAAPILAVQVRRQTAEEIADFADGMKSSSMLDARELEGPGTYNLAASARRRAAAFEQVAQFARQVGEADG